MRHGLLLVGEGSSIREMVDLSQAAEAAGMDSVYCVEGYRSAFVPLAAIAAATRRVRIGPYVANAYGRSPFLTAMSAIDLDELSGGRLVLGVGSGNRHINEDFQGIPHERPLRKLAEYVELLRLVFRTPKGGKVSYEGEVHRMRWRRSVPPLRPKIPVWLAAIFPKTVEVAARVADGVALGVLFSPEYVRDVIRPAAGAAAARAGRDPAELEFPMGALVAVDGDRERARRAIRRTICGFFHPLPHPYYDFLLREQGYSKVADAAARLVPEGRIEAAVDAIDDEVVDRLALAGSAAACARRLADYEGVVDEVIYLNVAEGDAAQGCRGIFEIRRS